MTYQQALDYVASLAPRGWRMGIDRMREFAHRAGLDDALGEGQSSTPQPPSSSSTNHLDEEGGSPRYIHVAGTNGKGSTTAFLQSMLHESGYRVGSFFSPYVYDPRERIQLGREYIPEGIFAGLVSMLKPIAEEFTETEFGGISEFEFKTAVALLFFKRLQCEWVALEVGLGGRLDATNIVTPACSVIVSVGLDHTNVLGNTIEEITREKAGIIKPGVPVVVGLMPREALKVIEQEAVATSSALWRMGEEIRAERDPKKVGKWIVRTPAATHAGLKVGIPGPMQVHNLALAVAAMDAAGATRTLGGLQRGSAQSSIPGRFERRSYKGKQVTFDGAHNADAAKVLAEALAREQRVVRVVMGMVAGHDIRAFARWLSEVATIAYVVPIDFHRAVPPTELAEELKALFATVHVYDSLEQGFELAVADAGSDDIVLVTGSFYLVGEVGRLMANS